MKILLDFHHTADINFFKEAVAILKRDHGCEFVFVVEPRGRLVSILKKELVGIPFIKIGEYRASLPGKMFGIIEWCLFILSRLPKEHIDIATGFGSVGLSFITWLLRKPSVIFDDDIEFKLGFYSYKPFATRIVLPQSISIKGKNIVKYNGFKELAYLHPNYFKPDIDALREYGIAESQYVFIREVSSSSLNYRNLKMGQLAGVCSYLKDLHLDVVLSLEDKSLTKQFENQCIILKEPVNDIYSLIHHALFTISSGDTMARESCLVGTPVIYTGGRKMSVNQELVTKGIFFEASDKQTILKLIKKIIKEDLKQKTQMIIQKALAEEWEDTSKVIIQNLMEVFQGS
jgi:predicted glycosyltransferase